MNTVQPRNDPGSQAMTQDQEIKQHVYLPQVENAEGNQSGTSTTAGLGTTAGQSSDSVEYKVTDFNQLNATRQPYLNIPYNETDQRSPRTKGYVSQDIPEAGRNQYQ